MDDVDNILSSDATLVEDYGRHCGAYPLLLQ